MEDVNFSAEWCRKSAIVCFFHSFCPEMFGIYRILFLYIILITEEYQDYTKSYSHIPQVFPQDAFQFFLPEIAKINIYPYYSAFLSSIYCFSHEYDSMIIHFLHE